MVPERISSDTVRMESRGSRKSTRIAVLAISQRSRSVFTFSVPPLKPPIWLIRIPASTKLWR